MRHIRCYSLLISLLLILIYPENGFSGVRSLSITDLVNFSDLVMIGDVTNIEPESNEFGVWVANSVTLSVEEVIKGVLDTSSLTIRVMGGKESPQFAIGEKTLLFLSQEGTFLDVVGGFQGKFLIKDNQVIGLGNTPLGTREEFVNQIKAIISSGQ